MRGDTKTGTHFGQEAGTMLHDACLLVVGCPHLQVTEGGQCHRQQLGQRMISPHQAGRVFHLPAAPEFFQFYPVSLESACFPQPDGCLSQADVPPLQA